MTDTEILKLPGNSSIYDFSRIKPIKSSPLKGKSVYLLGSSVAYGSASQQYSIGEYLAVRMDCTVVKEAVSGTTLTDIDGNSYVKRLKSGFNPDGGCDLFVLQLSTNDAALKLPPGEIGKSYDMNSFDTATVTGAAEFIIAYAKKTWKCPVVIFTGSRFESEAYGNMVRRALELKEKWEIGVLDLWSGDKFNHIPDEKREIYMCDCIHPTKAGYRDWWCPELEKQLCEYLSRIEK